MDAGGAVVEILLSGELETWVQQFGLNVTVVRPKDGTSKEVLGGRQWTYVIDLTTGETVWRQFGGYSGDDSSVGTGIAEMKRLLAE